MAYMHESVHICHVDVPFLMQLPFSASYPGNFVLVNEDYDSIWRIQLIMIKENAPEGEKKVEKNFEKIFKNNFFRNKKFLKKNFNRITFSCRNFWAVYQLGCEMFLVMNLTILKFDF